MPRLVAAFLCFAAYAAPQGLDVSSLDRNADPCGDFYQYACGGWLKNSPIPPDRPVWSKMSEVAQRTQDELKLMLEQAASDPKTSLDRQIGAHYAACMDEPGIEAAGLAPLKPVLDKIAATSNLEQLVNVLALLHRKGVSAAFNYGRTPDLKDARVMWSMLDQGGLSLPDRDYYLKTDARSVELLAKYRAHVTRMFELMGVPSPEAAARSQAVIKFETALAKASMDRVARRDPNNRYRRMTKAELGKIAPTFEWDRYFALVGAPAFRDLNAGAPDFLKQFDKQITEAPMDEWRAYLTFRYLNASAALLPSAFLNENFEFFGKTLSGAREMQPRWRRCVVSVDANLGEALGRKYVEAKFPADSKKRTLQLVHDVEDAFRRNLDTLEWMTPETKKKALEKLKLVTNKIGYPEHWLDYKSVAIHRKEPLANVERLKEEEHRRHMASIGKAVDRGEWRMTPPTVNAYYSPLENSINFPAARLQSPFFQPGADAALNYGGIAGVVGHELSHGFDDQGRKFDGFGNLQEWWTASDAKAFEERANCFVDQYAGYTAVGDVKLNGKLTLGENAADNGGVRLAYLALMHALSGEKPAAIDGFTPQQRFFIAYAHTRCDAATDQAARVRVMTDPHSPGKYRINGVLSNMPEFWSAFGCKPGQPMVREKACRVW